MARQRRPHGVWSTSLRAIQGLTDLFPAPAIQIRRSRAQVDCVCAFSRFKLTRRQTLVDGQRAVLRSEAIRRRTATKVVDK